MTRKNNRILAVILSLVMVLSSLPMLGVAQLALFTPRATAEGIDPLPGDVDGDGYLTTADARLIYRAVAMTEDPESFFGSGDLDGDGIVNSADARYAFRIASLQETNDSLAPARTLDNAEYESITQEVSIADYDEDGLVSLSVKSEAFTGVTDGFFVVSYDSDALSNEYCNIPLAAQKADVSGDGYVGCAFLYTEEAGGNEATLFEATFRSVGEPVDTEFTVTFITLNGGDSVWDSVSTSTEPLVFPPAVFAEPSGFVTFLGEQVVFSVGLTDYSDTQSGRIEFEYPADLLEYVGYVPGSHGNVNAEAGEGKLTIDFTCEAGDADEAQLCLAVFNPLRSGEVDYSVRLTGWNGEFNDDGFSFCETHCWISELWSENNTEFEIGDVFTYTYSVEGFTGAQSGDARLDIDPVMLEFVSRDNLLGSADHAEVNTDSGDHLDYSFDYSDGASGEDHAELFSVTLRALYPGECDLTVSCSNWNGADAPDEVRAPVKVVAAGDFGGLHWSISPEDGVMTIEGEGEMPGTWRPDEDYYEFMPWDDLKDLITAIEVREGVTSIADYAFFECGNLVSVSLPSTLESIGESAFARSGALQRVDLAVLPASIDSCAFRDDEALSEFNYPEGDLASACLGGERYVVEGWDVENRDDEQRLRDVFGGTPLFDAWYYDNFMQGDFDGFHWYMEENDDAYLAWNDEFNTPVGDGDEYDEDDVHLEEDLYTLYISGEGAMPDFIYDRCRREGDEREERIQPWDRERHRVSRLVVGDGVTEIGDRSFCWFDNLREVELPDTLERIGEWAFELCQSADDDGNVIDSLRGITIPASVTEIDRDAFRAVKYLEDIDYESLIDICLAGERYDDDRPDNDCDRVEAVFGDVDSFYEWKDAYYYEHYMQGECGANGDNLTWRLEDTDGFWVYEDTGEPVEDENDFGAPGTRREPRYTLFITGEGDMKDFFYGNEEEGEESDPQPWDRERWKICRVIIGDGVTSVGDSAFLWCDNLRWVTLPDTLERIGENAFRDCCTGEGEGEDWHPTDSLRAVTIPESVGYIGREAFRNIPFLESVECSRDLREICLPDEDHDPVDRVRDVFDDDTEFFIGWYAENCLQGECGANGDNLTWALEDTDGFWVYDDTGEQVEDENDFGVPGTRREPRYTLFITGEGDMKDFFYGDPELEEPYDPQPWERDRDKIAAVEIGPNVTSIGDSAFRWSSNLRMVNLPEDTLERIGEFAFEGCCSGEGEDWYPTDSLGYVRIPESVGYIGRGAFRNNPFLETVECSRDLREICLPDEDRDPVDRVRDVFDDNTEFYADWYAENYLQGECGKDGDNLTWRLEENGGYWAYNDGGDRVEDEDDFGAEYTHWEPFYTLYIEGEGEMASFFYGDPELEEPYFPQPWDRDRWNIVAVELAPGVTSVGDSAFRWCGNLLDVTLPDGLLSIGEFAFESCCSGEGEGINWRPTGGLGSIVIPGSVTSIGERAFADNPMLEDVVFDSEDDVRTVCLAGERYEGWNVDDWDSIDRLRHVFDNTAYFDGVYYGEFMQGRCGENVTWYLEENEDGFLAHNDLDNTPVGKDEEYDVYEVHWETRYTLYIEGEGEMWDFVYEDFKEEGDERDEFRQLWERDRWQISRVDVGEGVTHIGDNAFRWSNNLRGVTLPEGLLSIGEWAFENCQDVEWHTADDYTVYDSLREISIPGTVTCIGRGAFTFNEFLEEVEFDGDLRDVCLNGEKYADMWDDGEDPFLAIDRVRQVFDDTPFYDSWLHDEYLSGECGEGVEWELVFNEDSGWYDNETRERIADEDVDEEDGSMHYEPRFTLVIKGEGRTQGYLYTDFWYVNGEEEDAPLPWDLFLDDITAIEVQEGVTGLLDFTMTGRNVRRIDLPASLDTIDELTFCGLESLSVINVAEGNTVFRVYNGALYDKDLTTLVIYPVKSLPEEFTAPCTVRDIAVSAFEYATSLKTLYLFGNESDWEGFARELVPEGLEVVFLGYYHDWDDGEITTPKGCLTPGVKTYTCSFCGTTYTEDIPAYGSHDLVDHAAKAPTCTEAGWNAYQTCSRCDYSTYAEIPAKGHGETELRGVRAATCTEDGYTGDTYCKDCNTKLADGTAVNAPGHSWGEWTVVTAATCTEKGVERRVCGRDSTHVETRDIAAKGHGETELRGVRAATCTEAGYTGDTYCKVCNTKLADGQIVPASGHSWGEWTVVTAATCTEKGVERRVCGKDPTHAETRDVAAKGHGETELRGVRAATCTEAGYTGDTYCKDCNRKIADGQIVPASGHSWGEWTVVTAATCTEKGVEKRVCGKDPTHAETRELSATGHADNDGDGVCDICSTVLRVPEPPVSEPGTTQPPTTQPPTTQAPTTQSPTTQGPAPITTTKTPEPTTVPETIFTPENKNKENVDLIETGSDVRIASVTALTKSEIVASIVSFDDAVVTVKDKDGVILPDEAKAGTGSTVTVTLGSVSVTKTIVIMGDADGDANVTATDARLALRAAAKLDTLAGAFGLAADTDGDSNINAVDARGILRVAAKLDKAVNWRVFQGSAE